METQKASTTMHPEDVPLAARLTQLRKGVRKIVKGVLDNEGLETIFTHARNVLTGAAVLAAGMYAVNHFSTNRLPGMWNLRFAGYVVAGVGAMLLLLNLLSGLRRLARRKHHLVLRIIAIVIYTGLSIRLTQVIVYFRWAT